MLCMGFVKPWSKTLLVKSAKSFLQPFMIITIAYFSLPACTTIDKRAINSTRTATIVAFDGRITSKSPRLFNFFKATINQKFAKKMLFATEKYFASSFKWRMISNETWAKSRSYQRLANSKMQKTIEYFSTNEFTFKSPHLLINTGWIGDKKRRNVVFSATKADVVIGLTVMVDPVLVGNNVISSVLKTSSFSIQAFEAKIALVAYKRGYDDPIWEDRQFFAHKGQGAVPALFGVSFTNVREQQIMAAFKNALFALVKDVQES
jgi:hypothetical protein